MFAGRYCDPSCLLVSSLVCSFVSLHPSIGYNGSWAAGGTVGARQASGVAGRRRCMDLVEVAPYEHFFKLLLYTVVMTQVVKNQRAKTKNYKKYSAVLSI